MKTRKTSSSISLPISNLGFCLKSDTPFVGANNIEEIQFLIKEINFWKTKVKQAQTQENSEKLASIAAQLAHDIRSPLSAIAMMVKNIENTPENSRVALRNAIQRISDISNNFLEQYKKPNDGINEYQPSSEYIPSLIESIISEKRSQYLERDINIQLIICDNAWDVFSEINPVDFKRVISNIVNNSVEAIHSTGVINIKLIKSDLHLKIVISDNGTGIPPETLDKVKTGGISIGKINGFGLGLSHAINKIQSWHGTLEMKSEVENGTTLIINLPLTCMKSNRFKSCLSLSPNQVICILDDEQYTHHLWINKLKNSQAFHCPIHNFYSPQDAAAFANQLTQKNFIFLIDLDLGTGKISGLDFILKFNLQKYATLVTNRYDDQEIQERCLNLEIKILPKNLIQYIPIYYHD